MGKGSTMRKRKPERSAGLFASVEAESEARRDGFYEPSVWVREVIACVIAQGWRLEPVGKGRGYRITDSAGNLVGAKACTKEHVYDREGNIPMSVFNAVLASAKNPQPA
jgi:hypothetical protein